jgi:hypothetical protein
MSHPAILDIADLNILAIYHVDPLRLAYNRMGLANVLLTVEDFPLL